MVISCRINVTNLKQLVKESISLKRVMGQHLFKASFGCHVRSSLIAALKCKINFCKFSIPHNFSYADFTLQQTAKRGYC